MTTNNPVGAMSKLHEAAFAYGDAVRENCAGVTYSNIDCDIRTLEGVGRRIRGLALDIESAFRDMYAVSDRPKASEIARQIAETVTDELGVHSLSRAAAAIIMAAAEDE